MGIIHIYFLNVCICEPLELHDIVLDLEPITDVAVTKRHQRLNKIRTIFTQNSFKSCFQKSSLSCKARPRHLTQGSLHSKRLRSCCKCTFHTTYACLRCMRTGRKKNFDDSSIVRVKNMISFCRWWRFLTATCAIKLILSYLFTLHRS